MFPKVQKLNINGAEAWNHWLFSSRACWVIICRQTILLSQFSGKEVVKKETKSNSGLFYFTKEQLQSIFQDRYVFSSSKSWIATVAVICNSYSTVDSKRFPNHEIVFILFYGGKNNVVFFWQKPIFCYFFRYTFCGKE